MSTRCRIDFIIKWIDEKGKEHTERRCVYRHNDGYPEGVIPDLKEFLEWNAGRNNDVEYTTANFIYWSKHRMEKYLREGEKWDDKDSNSICHIGFGVCAKDCWHGDLEYYYEVLLNDDTTKSKIVKSKVYQVKVYKMPDRKYIKTVNISKFEEE